LIDNFPSEIAEAMIVDHSFFTQDGSLIQIPLAIFSKTKSFGLDNDTLWKYTEELREKGWKLIKILL